MQGYWDIFLWIILKQTSTEAHVYMRRQQGVKDEHFDVSNVIYHKFSHGAVSYRLHGENANVKLEFDLFDDMNFHFHDVKWCNVASGKVHVNTCITVKTVGRNFFMQWQKTVNT